MKVSVIGLGFVGSAMFESFKQKGVTDLIGYDKYKKISATTKGKINPQNLLVGICPYCMKEGQFVAMKRWHFDNCKLNVKDSPYA